MKKNKYLKPILMIVFFLFVAIFVPMVNTNQYMMTVLIMSMIYFIAVLGLNIILGMGGQVTFSTAGIMGIGAFMSGALTTKLGIHPLLALLASVVATGIFSYISGLALFRLKGSYFSFASIGLAQILYIVMQSWVPVTGGADGITGIPPLDLVIFKCTTVQDYFYVVLIFSLLAGFIVHRIRKSYFGRALASVRDDEIAAQCMGINVYRTKVMSFVVAGMLAGVAGSLLAHLNTYISAESFTFDQSAIYLIMAMLGGVDSTVGAFIGSFLLTMLPEWLRVLAIYYKFVYGVGVIILMVVMPMGLMGLWKVVTRKIKVSRK